MFRKTLLLASIVSSLIMTQSCSLFEKDVYIIAPVPEIQNKFEPNIVWKNSVGDGVEKFFSTMVPAISETKVFAAARDGTVKAIDRYTGDTVWKIDLDDEEENDDRRSARISGGVGLGFDAIYVGSENGYLYAIDRSEGKLKWKVNVGYEIVSCPLALSDIVIVLTTSGQLFAISDVDGSVLWKTPEESRELTLRGTSNPISFEGDRVIMYGTSQGKLSIVDSQTGMLLRSHLVSLPKGGTTIDKIADVDATPVFYDGRIFLVGYHGDVMSMSPSGDSFRKKLSSYQNISNDYSDIFVTDDEGHVHSISQTNGDERWLNRDLSYRDVTAPVSFDNYILVGDMDGYLYWLNNATGEIESMDEYDSDGLYMPPVIYDGYAYLQTRSGKIYAITLKNSEQVDSDVRIYKDSLSSED